MEITENMKKINLTENLKEYQLNNLSEIEKHKLVYKIAKNPDIVEEILAKKRELEAWKIRSADLQIEKMNNLLAKILEYLVAGFFESKNKVHKNFMIDEIKKFYIAQKFSEFPIEYPNKKSVWTQENLAEFIKELEK